MIDDLDRARAVALYLRLLALLLESGVALIRAMDILTESIPDDELRAGHTAMMAAIRDERTLSEAMAACPALFPVPVRAMVRAGEIGGVLDETMDRAARYLEKDLELLDRLGVPPGGLARHAAWLTTGDSRKAVEMRFCLAFGTMLSSGVPIAQALRESATLLDDERRERLIANVDLVPREGHFAELMAGLGIFSPSTEAFVAVGCATGRLDFLMLRAADYLEAEVLAAGRRTPA